MSKYEALGIQRFDHLEFAVQDLEKTSERFLRLGFEPVGTREIRERALKSHLMAQGENFILLTNSAQATDPVFKYLAQHGDGLYALGFLCTDAVSTAEVAVNRGAEIADSPKSYQKDFGTVQQAGVRGFGDVRHTFLSRSGGLFAEGFDVPTRTPQLASGAPGVAQVVCDLEPTIWQSALENYKNLYGLRAEPSSSAAEANLESPDGKIKIRLRSPTGGDHEISEFLEVHHGAGVHTAVLSTDQLTGVMRSLRKHGLASQRGVEVPHFDFARRQFPELEDSWLELQEHGIRFESLGEHGYRLRGATEKVAGSFFFEFVETRMPTRGAAHP